MGFWVAAGGGASSAPSNPGGTSSSSRPTIPDRVKDTVTIRDKEKGKAGRINLMMKKRSIEDYRKSRKFVFIHHFAGKNDVLGKALLAAADVHGLKIEVISVDKEANSGNLMEAEPFESHLLMAKQGKVDG